MAENMAEQPQIPAEMAAAIESGNRRAAWQTAFGAAKRDARQEIIDRLKLNELKDVSFEEILKQYRLFCYTAVVLEREGEFLPKKQTDRADRYMDTITDVEKSFMAREMKKRAKSDKGVDDEEAAKLLMDFRKGKGDDDSGRAG